MARDANTDALKAIDDKARNGEAAAITAGVTPPPDVEPLTPLESGAVRTRDGHIIPAPEPGEPGKTGGA